MDQESNETKTDRTPKFLQQSNNSAKKQQKKVKKDLLAGYKFKNSFEVHLNPYTKMVCTLFESESKPGLFRIEQRIGYNRIVYDGNFSFVVAETLKELGKPFVPENLRPKVEGSS